jgi:uncharacterized membrane protein
MTFFSIKNIVDTFGLFYVNDYPFLMMVWNLFLAILPFFIFLVFRRYWKKTKFKKTGQKIIAALIFFFWFIFLPNAAYLIVDNRHLLNYCPADSSYGVCVAGAWQIMFFFCYSVIGWIFFVIFLVQMKKMLAEIFNKKKATLAVYVLIPMVSLGVLLGLTERFNSWDVFAHPLAISAGLLRYITDWQYLWNLAVFIVGYYLLYFLGDYLFGKKVTS